MIVQAQVNPPKCSVFLQLPMVTEVPFAIFSGSA